MILIRSIKVARRRWEVAMGPYNPGFREFECQQLIINKSAVHFALSPPTMIYRPFNFYDSAKWLATFTGQPRKLILVNVSWKVKQIVPPGCRQKTCFGSLFLLGTRKIVKPFREFIENLIWCINFISPGDVFFIMLKPLNNECLIILKSVCVIVISRNLM